MDTVIDRDIVDVLILHEESVAALYAAFADALPCMKDFWSILNMEEKAHAEVLRMLAGRMGQDGVTLSHRKFSVPAVQTSIDYLRKQTSMVRSEIMTSARALSLALDLERSGLESEYFEVFESDSKEINKEFAALIAHEKSHYQLIKERFEQENKTDSTTCT
jgi:hypothetical protein